MLYNLKIYDTPKIPYKTYALLLQTIYSLSHGNENIDV